MILVILIFLSMGAVSAADNGTNSILSTLDSDTLSVDDSGSIMSIPTDSSTSNIKVEGPSLKVDINPDNITVGNNTILNYTIIVTNDGTEDLEDVNIETIANLGKIAFIDHNYTDFSKEDFDKNFEGMNKEDNYYCESYEAVWYLKNIQAGQSVRLWITGITKETGKESIFAAASDENIYSEDAEATVNIVPVTLNINKTSDKKNVSVSSEHHKYDVAYTIVVRNPSETNATELVVTDVMPQFVKCIEASYVPITGINIITEQSSEKVKWTISNLDNKTSVTLWVKTEIDDNSYSLWDNITNTVQVNCKENETYVNDNCNVNVIPINITIIVFYRINFS